MIKDLHSNMRCKTDVKENKLQIFRKIEQMVNFLCEKFISLMENIFIFFYILSRGSGYI